MALINKRKKEKGKEKKVRKEKKKERKKFKSSSLSFCLTPSTPSSFSILSSSQSNLSEAVKLHTTYRLALLNSSSRSTNPSCVLLIILSMESFNLVISSITSLTSLGACEWGQ